MQLILLLCACIGFLNASIACYINYHVHQKRIKKLGEEEGCMTLREKFQNFAWFVSAATLTFAFINYKTMSSSSSSNI